MNVNMLMNKWVKQNAAGDGGSGGGGSLLAPSSGGGAAAGAAASAAASAAANSGAAATGDAGASGGSGGTSAPDWRSALPKELQEDVSLKKFTSLEALAGAYKSAEKMIGADKIVVPNQNSTDEDWRNAFKKLGLPESADKYDVKFPDDAKINKEFIKEFRDAAFKSGVLPKQAQQLADWFTSVNAKAETDVKSAYETRQKTEIDGLRKEWGQAFDQNLSRAQLVVEKFGDPKIAEFLKQSGMGNDANLIRLLSKVGNEHFKEDAIVGAATSGGKFSPAEATKKISEIQGDPKHPYYLKDHPGHKAAVDEVRGLFDLVHGVKED